MSEAVDELPAVRDVPPAPENVLEKFYIIENQTARSLKIEPKDNHLCAPLTIVPFGTRKIAEQQRDDFDFQRWEDLGLIIVLPPERQPDQSKARSKSTYIIIAAILVGVGLLGVIVPKILDPILTSLGITNKPLSFLITGQSLPNPITEIQKILLNLYPLFLLCIIAAPLVLGAMYLFTHRTTWRKQDGGVLALGFVAATVIAVAAIGPAFIMLSFIPTINEDITGRMMQMIFVVIAALLPALLYFLYDRQKVSIVSKTFYREVVRLDPTIHTSVDAEQKYGHLINEVYGDKSAGYYLANVGLPITLSSVLIALGWLLILLPIFPAHLADFFNLVAPLPSALSFGFLGAYFFALNMVFRRYVRSDLTPKAYSHITVRLLVTTILVWVVSVLPVFQSSPQSLLILAFCIGVVPETAIRVIQEFMHKIVGSVSGLEERDPLTNLEGIDLYDRARLSEEGVDNIENLAYHNFINLLVQTRIPARRLADMVDQAILYLHVRSTPTPEQFAAAAGKTDSKPGKEAGKTDNGPPPVLEYLRSYGIRTATDLLYVWRKITSQGSSAFAEILGNQSNESKEFANRIYFVVGTLKEADWMLQLLYRRALVAQLPGEDVIDADNFFVTNPDEFLKKETEYVIWLFKEMKKDVPLPVPLTSAGPSTKQIVASAPVIEASATLPVTVETLKPHG